MTKTNSSDNLIQGLETSSELSKSTGHPGPGIKPCIATLIESPLTKGGFPQRNEAGLVIASELKRIGQNYDQVLSRLQYWNQHNNPPLRYSELQHITNCAFRKDYKYSCLNPILSAFCIGEDVCPFVNGVRSEKPKYNDLVFLDRGWQCFLTTTQSAIYWIGLKYLEVCRHIGKGGRIFANHTQIAKASGVSLSSIRRNLKILQKVGLIEYKPGTPRKWEGCASEIRRIFPVPYPTIDRIRLLKHSKQGDSICPKGMPIKGI